MKVEEAQATVARLKAAYPSAKALDEITTDLYTETLASMDSRDVFPACKAMVSHLKFFPSIAEICEAVDAERRRRLAAADSQSREKRLAGDIMDPKAEIHRKVVGPNHAKFLRMLSGEEPLPEPEWMTKRRVRS